MYRLTASCLLCLICVAANAELRLPSIFSDHMVVQRDRELPVWGWADPKTTVRAELGDATAETLSDSDGNWTLKLAPTAAGGPHRLMVQQGDELIVIEDVLVGEVWICSGQSNMEWKVTHSMDAVREVASASHPRIRLFDVPNTVAAEPQDDVDASWRVCRPSQIADFSAVAYYFGRALEDSLDVPIGLIHTSWGGSAVETWISDEAVESGGAFAELASSWDKSLEEHETEILKYYNTMGAQLDDTYYAMDAAVPMTFAAKPPSVGRLLMPFPGVPSRTYNAMAAPLTRYPVRGFIWYQGESNASRAYEYRSLMRELIRDWRARWDNPEAPFLMVQLANFQQRKDEPGESAWAELREAQSMAVDEGDVGVAVAIDIGDANDIHPKNKQEVGRRLALLARRIAYGEDLVASGPVYESMQVDGNRVRVQFRETGGGLKSKEGKELRGFAIAGSDRKFVWAEATIDGDEVMVWSDSVSAPVAVRYAWADNPVADLYNAQDLPASPFRTDDWPGVTAPKE